MKRIRILCLFFAIALLIAGMSCMFLVQSTYAKYSSTTSATHKTTFNGENQCYGGTATCYERAECEVCHNRYGDFYHSGEQVWKYDGTQHWKEWSCCDQLATEKTNHTHVNNECECGHIDHVHDYQPVAEVAPTCQSTGMAAHYTCANDCGKLFVEIDEVMTEVREADLIIPKAEHLYENYTEYIAATCTRNAWERSACSYAAYGCDFVSEREVAESALGHTLQAVVIREATCTVDGLYQDRCTRCKKNIGSQQVIEATGHPEDSLITLSGYAATCTKDGLSVGKFCTECGEVAVEQEVITAPGHTLETLAGRDATCSVAGLTEGKRCTVCKVVTTAQQTIPATGHTIRELPAVAATCTNTGLSTGQMCSVCGVVTEAQTVTQALGHEYVTYTSNNDRTCTQAGTKTASCTRGCGATKTITDESAPATGHTRQTIDAVAPTCTSVGYTAGVKCSVCDTVLTAQNIINAKGHDYDGGIITVQPTCTGEGYMTFTCQRDGCGAIYTETIPATGHAVIYDPSTGDVSCANCNYDNPSLTPKYFFGKADLANGTFIYGDGVARGGEGSVIDNGTYLTIKDIAAPVNGHAVQYRVIFNEQLTFETSSGNAGKNMYLVLKYRITGNNALAKNSGGISLVFDMATRISPMIDFIKDGWFYAAFDISSYFTASGSYQLPHPMIGFIFDGTGVSGDSIDIECVGICESEVQAALWGQTITNRDTQIFGGIIDSVADVREAFGYELWTQKVCLDPGTAANGISVSGNGQSVEFAQDTVYSITYAGDVFTLNLVGHANFVCEGSNIAIPITKIGYTIDSLDQDDIVWKQTAENGTIVEHPDLDVAIGRNATRFTFAITDGLDIEVGESVTVRIVYELGNGLVVTAATILVSAVAPQA